MALINCPECNKEISDRAEACPQCGFPIAKKNEIKLECPAFSDDLSLGTQITAWGYDAGIKGKFIKSENVITTLPEGTVHAILYEYGIQIRCSFHSQIMNIHASQLIDISETTEVELVEQNKSVIGRAAVGALLFGPFGGIVGGLSGINTTKTNTKKMLVISFWNTETKEPTSLIIRTDNPLGVFISKCKSKIGVY